MEIKVDAITFNLEDGTTVTVKDLISHWTRTHNVAPAGAQLCYAYYRENGSTHEEYLHHALWHPDTRCGAGERMVPGYFTPLVDSAPAGINEAHQFVVEALHQYVTGVDDKIKRAVFDAMARGWPTVNPMETAIRVAMQRAGLDEDEFDRRDPAAALVKIAEFWTTYGKANADELTVTDHPGLPPLTPIIELNDAMEKAGERAVDKAREDGCAGIHTLCRVYYEAAMIEHQNVLDDADALKAQAQSDTTAIKYCNVCERPSFNGHDVGCVNDVDAIPEPEGDADLIDEEAAWPPTGLFRHTDGGMYEVLYGASSSEDKSRTVVYRHRWPFEPGIWTRPYSEWNSRFKQITVNQYHEAVDAMSQKDAMAQVSERREKRKALERKRKEAAEAEARGQSPVIDTLESIEVLVNTVLYDAYGKQWVAHVPTTDGYAFKLVPLTKEVGDASVWHANQYQVDGTQLLFWENPQADLKLRWEPRMFGSVPVWEVDTPFGLLQIHKNASRVHPWFINTLCGVKLASEDAGYATQNAAMIAAERHYSLKLSKAKGDLATNKGQQ